MYEISPTSKAITHNVAKWRLYESRTDNIEDELNEKVIMLVGGTGTGKSSLINRIANYIIGVEYQDPYRFEVVPIATLEEQTNSRTKWITIYQFCKSDQLGFNLSIIDTPGFSDTTGKHKDKQTIEAIKKLFSSGAMPKLDAVGFVARYNDVRLTESQREVFQSLKKMFTSNTELTIFIMSTFCDDPETDSPPVVAALKQENINFHRIFCFNNNILARKSKLQELYWDMSYSSCSQLLEKLNETKPVSAQFNDDCLQKHENMMIHLFYLKNKVMETMYDMEQFVIDKKLIDSKRKEIEGNKDFEHQTTEYLTKLVDISQPNQFAVRCSICNVECCYPTTVKTKSLKWCKAMTWTDIKFRYKIHCTICPRKCSWKDHISTRLHSTRSLQHTIKTGKDIKSKYNVLQEEEDIYEKLLENWKKKYLDTYKQLLGGIKEMKICIKDMQVALNISSSLPNNTESFIQQIITSEDIKQKQGYETSIKYHVKLLSIVNTNMREEFELGNDVKMMDQAQKFFSY